MDIIARPQPRVTKRQVLLTIAVVVGFIVGGAVLAAVLPVVIIICLISIIGIPLGFPLLWSIPILGYALPWLALARILKIWQVKHHYLFALALVLAGAQVYVVLSNHLAQSDVQALLVPDQEAQPLPSPVPRSLIFIKSEENMPKPRKPWCDWVCQELLLQEKASVIGIGYHAPKRERIGYNLPAQQPLLKIRYYSLRQAVDCKIEETYETGIANWLDLPGFRFTPDRRSYWLERRQKLFDSQGLCLLELPEHEVPDRSLVFDYTEVREHDLSFSAGIPNLQRLQVRLIEGTTETPLFSRTLAKVKHLKFPLRLELDFGAEFRSHYQFAFSQQFVPNGLDTKTPYFGRDDLIEGQTIGAFLQSAGYLPTLDMTGIPLDPKRD